MFLFTAATIGVEILVVVHWFLLPDNWYLFAVAMVAGVGMCLMAAVDFRLMFAVFRRDASVPQQRKELEDLAHIEPLWAFATTVQIFFIAAAFLAGVYWMAIALIIGQGAELISVATARIRIRASHPGVVA